MSMRTRRPARRTLQAVATAGTAAVAVGLLPAAAWAQEAREAAPVAATEEAQAAKAKNFTYLSFKKNKKDPSNSRLSLVFVQRVNPDKTRTWTVDTWRAGSGMGTAKNKIGRNACVSNVGWLPSGTYKIGKFHNNFDGVINGHVWKLESKRCTSNPKSTLRWGLFIHSEMAPNGKPGKTEPERWDGNSDYKSEGCIKLKPSDIRELRATGRSTRSRPSCTCRKPAGAGVMRGAGLTSPAPRACPQRAS